MTVGPGFFQRTQMAQTLFGPKLARPLVAALPLPARRFDRAAANRPAPRGDLLVQMYIEVPKKLTPQQEQLLRELAEVEHAHVTPQRKSFLEKLREYFSPADDPEPQVKDQA